MTSVDIRVNSRSCWIRLLSQALVLMVPNWFTLSAVGWRVALLLQTGMPMPRRPR